MRNLKFAACAVLLGMTAAPAYADFEFTSSKDDFDDTVRYYITNYNENGQAITVNPEKAKNGELDGSINVQLEPKVSFICGNARNYIGLEYITISKGVKSKLKKVDGLVTKSPGGVIIESGLGAEQVYRDMRSSDEIRIRYIDECGDSQSMAFKTDGLASAVAIFSHSAGRKEPAN